MPPSLVTSSNVVWPSMIASGAYPSAAHSRSGSLSHLARNEGNTLQRERANSGQEGHNKTNRELCTLLNATLGEDKLSLGAGGGEPGFVAA
jgi:hypothetical protein